MAEGDDRAPGVLLGPTGLHSAQRVSLSGKRSGGLRRWQLEHLGHPMRGDFNKPLGRSASLLRTGRLAVFDPPQERFEPLLIEPVGLAALMFPMLDCGNPDA
jgi:hypothetical protein